MYKTLALLIGLFSLISAGAQKSRFDIEVVNSGTATSLRGLSVVNDNIVWVSGSKGMVGKSVNGGKNWKWVTVKGFEKSEFRDIEAFDANTAVIMAVGSPAYILKTTDGGDSWKIVLEDKRAEMFLDAMDFANGRMGMVIGDPINGHPYIAVTENSGNTWRELKPEEHGLAVDSGEAFFAASGGNLRYFANGEFWLVSGGKKSRLLHSGGMSAALPILQGNESTGANAIDIYDGGFAQRPGKRMVIVGGDFAADSIRTGSCVFSTDGGKSWQRSKTPPMGYRSGVEFIGKKHLIACGLNGVDYSFNSGKTWKPIDKNSYHVVKIARSGTTIYMAGNKGRIAKITVKKR